MIPTAPHLATFDPSTVLLVAGVTALYLRGARRRAVRVPRRPSRTIAFLIGGAVLLLAELGPVADGAERLFWAHMVQHLLITVVVAPLIAWSTPVRTIRHALSARARHALARPARALHRLHRSVGRPHPLPLATMAHVTVLWTWHVPPLYDAAVRSAPAHLLEHALLLGAAGWFWSEIWSSARRSPHRQALATLSLGAMIIQGGVLGATITFADRSLYDVYTGTAGLSALEDQQLAGALMWVPPGFLYATVAVRRFIAWLASAGPGRAGSAGGSGGRASSESSKPAIPSPPVPPPSGATVWRSPPRDPGPSGATTSRSPPPARPEDVQAHPDRAYPTPTSPWSVGSRAQYPRRPRTS